MCASVGLTDPGRQKARPPHGAALVMSVIIMALVVACAAILCTYLSMLSVQATHGVQALQHDLLLLAAEEEARARLACDQDVQAPLQNVRMTRTVQAHDGTTVGVYHVRLQDVCAQRPADTATARITTLVGAAEQPVWYWQSGQVCAPDPVNALTPAAAAHLAPVLRAAPHRVAAATVAALMDASDDDHALSTVAGVAGDEGLSLQAWPQAPLFHAVAFACRATNASIHVGRLARGWSGWNSDVHFYPVAPRTTATRARATVTLTKQYGRRTLERQYQTALNTLAPGAVNQFGVSNMWRGAVIKAVIAQNTCRADAEEWLLVEANYASGDDMTFACVPLFGDLFSTQFVAKASGDLCQYGWHGWTVTHDPLVPNEVKSETTPGLLCAPATRIVPLESHSSAKPYYVCDAIVVRGLRRDGRYLVELVGDPRGRQSGVVEVLNGSAYQPVTLRNGRALLFDGASQCPLPAAHGREGVLIIALRVPAHAAPCAVFGVELRAMPEDAPADDSTPTALCAWDNRSATPIDVRGWSWAGCDADQRTQWLGRITQRRDGAAAFTSPTHAFALQQAFSLDAGSPAQSDCDVFVLDASRAIRARAPGPVDHDSQMQQHTIVVDGAPFLPGELCQRFVRLLPPDAYAATLPHRLLRCSPAFAVVTNDARTLTISVPLLSRELAAWLARCTTLEPLDAPGSASLRTLLLDADQRCAASVPACSPAVVSVPALPRPAVPNKAFDTMAALHAYLTDAGADAHDGAPAWNLCEALHCAYLPLSGTQLAPEGILQLQVNDTRLTPRGLVNYAWNWQPAECDNLYVRFPHWAVSNERFRVINTCAHCLDLDPRGFPHRRLLPGANAATGMARRAGMVEFVTAAGTPVMLARAAGSGFVRVRVPAGLVDELALSMRSEARAPCRAVISIFDPSPAVWRSTATNSCVAMRWLTPTVQVTPGSTTLLVRIDLLDVPRPHVRFFDVAWVPTPRRMGALNVNTADVDTMVTALHWPRARAAAVVAARPVTSLAALHAVTGMTDAELLAAVPHIVLRSDQWTADVRADTPSARTARHSILQRHTLPAATLHPVIVRARMPRQTDL